MMYFCFESFKNVFWTRYSLCDTFYFYLFFFLCDCRQLRAELFPCAVGVHQATGMSKPENATPEQQLSAGLRL